MVEKCEAVCSPEVNLRQRILDNLPGEAAVKRDKAPILGDVASGKDTMDDFVAGLSDDELEALTRGHGMMNSPLAPRPEQPPIFFTSTTISVTAPSGPPAP